MYRFNNGLDPNCATHDRATQYHATHDRATHERATHDRPHDLATYDRATHVRYTTDQHLETTHNTGLEARAISASVNLRLSERREVRFESSRLRRYTIADPKVPWPSGNGILNSKQSKRERRKFYGSNQLAISP